MQAFGTYELPALLQKVLEINLIHREMFLFPILFDGSSSPFRAQAFYSVP
jgi:hypothetical protein